MEEIEVPQFFICPISLQMMTDPVTLSSGITYDRQSIEKWLFSGKNTTCTCPVTKVPLTSDADLTPNHTLRRLIQSWCTLNAHHGIDRIPTPKPPVTKSLVSKLLAASPSGVLLRRLKSIAADNESNKRVIEAAGGVNFLASTIIQYDYDNNSSSSSSSDSTNCIVNDAMFLLHTLQLSESGLKTLLSTENDVRFIDALSKVMEKGSYESRVYAVFILRSMVEIADPVLLSGFNTNMFLQVIQLLKDQISRKASKACLQVLTTALRWGHNKVKVAKAGAVTALVELLLTSTDKRMCELMLTAMEMVCRCAEGRAELVGHGAGLAVVSKKILRVSVTASDRGVRILNWVSRYSATPAVLQEMLQVGAVAKLCYVVELERWGIGSRIKEKAAEVIKLHARTWRTSPCVPHTHLLFS